MTEVPGWPVAFRGSEAIAAGLVTAGVLRGRRFARLYPDTYVRARPGSPDLLLRSHAAYRYVAGRGVLAGHSAAEVLGASCGPLDASAEVAILGGGQRAHRGLRVHRTSLAPGEIGDVLALRAAAGLRETPEARTLRGVQVTTPLRTAFDLARRLDLVEGVVAVDRLVNVYGFSPDLLLHFAVHYPGLRGNDRIEDVLTYADRRSGSPMESRLRMLIVLAGLPRPQVQWPVQDERTRTVVWLDLAYPDRMVAIEYEGGDHTTPDGVRRDIARYTRLVDRGWRIYRYTTGEIGREPDRILAEITRALTRAA